MGRIALLLLCGCLPLGALAENNVFHINTGFPPPVADIYRLVLNDAFNRIGARVDLRSIAGERSLRLANQGIDDGDCCRIREINQHYPNLVRVEVPVIQVDFVAFVKDESIRLDGWHSLAPYDVGVVKGWKILESGLADHSPRKVYTLNSAQSLFSMLEKDRLQVATIGRLVGYKKLHDMGLQGIRVVEPPLVSRQLYLFLNKKHEALVPALEKILRQMREEGVLAAYYQQVVEPLLERR